LPHRQDIIEAPPAALGTGLANENVWSRWIGHRLQHLGPPATTEPHMAHQASQSLQEVKIFAKENTIWGIPSKLFIGSAVLTVALVTQIPTFFALAIGGLMFGVMFSIYNDDPRALQAWQRSMGRPVRWSACARKARQVCVLPFKD
jgi:hypothetical protein